MTVPRVEADGAPFGGCLASRGTISWRIPLNTLRETVRLPVPSGAQHASLVMTIEDQTQRVGAFSVDAPSGTRLYQPCPSPIATDCGPQDARDQYFDNKVRHQLGFGMSVLAMPSNPEVGL